MKFQPLPLMTLICAAVFGLLVLFGNWQWGRYHEKMSTKGAAPDWAEITGQTLPGTERLVYAYTEGDAAWRTVTGFETGDGIIFLPTRIHYTIEPPDLQTQAEPQILSLRGVWHSPQRRNAFTTPDDPAAGIFYTLDPQRLSAGLSPDQAARLVQEVFEPETLERADLSPPIPVANPFLQPGDSARLPPERHFGYAITWWGLAIALIGVYLAFHHQRGRLRFRRETP